MTTFYTNSDLAAKSLISKLNKNVIIAVPLGIGKPIGILNALYRAACEDSTIQLTILTGLTLSKPTIKNILERRLIEPIMQRVLGDYENPLYEEARLAQKLPHNITVLEFFLTPGNYLHNDYVQQNYISSSYAYIGADLKSYHVNAIAQLVTHSKEFPDQYSLSCNTDLFYEMYNYLMDLKSRGQAIGVLAEVNTNLPFMYGDDAVYDVKTFTEIVDTKHYKSLFALPRENLSPHEHLIGIYTSALIPDDGCLQVGIGKLGNTLANALIMRHNHNDEYRALLAELQIAHKFPELVPDINKLQPYHTGLYASTEMFSDEYLYLYKENILKKRVYDNLLLQRMLNEHVFSEKIEPPLIDLLIKNHVISSSFTHDDFKFLIRYGIFNDNIKYENGNIILTDGTIISADISLEKNKNLIINHCLGKTLKTGKIMHAGFFVGSKDLYNMLHHLPYDERHLIAMTSITRTNTLTNNPDLLRAQRLNMRCVNTAMMITLTGSIISDGLINMREVSGVGGQFDFVNMVRNLKDAYSIINCKSVRNDKNGIQSNIVWEYPNVTIPRYLRDIVVTEYGIAQCRGKTDSEVIKTILNITDSRFQAKLLQQAKDAGKINSDYKIPEKFSDNLPEKYDDIIRSFQLKGYCMPYPFGNDLTDDEMVLQEMLSSLKYVKKSKMLFLIFRSLFLFKNDKNFAPYLDRMQLLTPKTFEDFLYKKILKRLLYDYMLSKKDLVA